LEAGSHDLQGQRLAPANGPNKSNRDSFQNMFLSPKEDNGEYPVYNTSVFTVFIFSIDMEKDRNVAETNSMP
jgi:hypothetical protein